MAKKLTPFPQKLSSTEAPDQDQHVESIELITEEISKRASTTTIVLQKILAQGDDKNYAHRWGINE